jgi:hypothetical protein
VIRFD